MDQNREGQFVSHDHLLLAHYIKLLTSMSCVPTSIHFWLHLKNSRRRDAMKPSMKPIWWTEHAKEQENCSKAFLQITHGFFAMAALFHVINFCKCSDICWKRWKTSLASLGHFYLEYDLLGFKHYTVVMDSYIQWYRIRKHFYLSSVSWRLGMFEWVHYWEMDNDTLRLWKRSQWLLTTRSASVEQVFSNPRLAL